MAGTSPAMTAEKTTYGFQRFISSPFLATTRSYAACKRSPTLGPAFLRRFTPRMGPVRQQ